MLTQTQMEAANGNTRRVDARCPGVWGEQGRNQGRFSRFLPDTHRELTTTPGSFRGKARGAVRISVVGEERRGGFYYWTFEKTTSFWYVILQESRNEKDKKYKTQKGLDRRN